jgi:hypothetical protein
MFAEICKGFGSANCRHNLGLSLDTDLGDRKLEPVSESVVIFVAAARTWYPTNVRLSRSVNMRSERRKVSKSEMRWASASTCGVGDFSHRHHHFQLERTEDGWLTFGHRVRDPWYQQ